MAELIMQEEASTPSTPASGKWVAYFKSDGLYIKDDAGNELGPIGNSGKGYLRENSAQLLYVGAQAYSVLPGSADVNGTLLTWAADIARTSLTLTADTLYNVYLYSNSGTPAVEESTTAPVWDSALNYYKKTGDATRRWIGFLNASATNTIRKFVNISVGGRVSETIYVDGSVTGKSAVNAGSGSSSWTSFSLATLVPLTATHFYAISRLTGTSANDDAAAGISPIDLGSGIVGSLAPYVVRGDNDVAGATIFFGTAWLSIYTAQTAYYRIYHVVGTGSTLTLQVHGARFIR